MADSFSLRLQSAAKREQIDAVTGFIGEDDSGSFGILPGRAPFMTILGYGLSRFRVGGGEWQFLACPGAVLSFGNGRLCVMTRRYLCSASYERIVTELENQLAEEERALQDVKENLQKLEQELIRRLYELNRRS